MQRSHALHFQISKNVHQCVVEKIESYFIHSKYCCFKVSSSVLTTFHFIFSLFATQIPLNLSSISSIGHQQLQDWVECALRHKLPNVDQIIRLYGGVEFVAAVFLYCLLMLIAFSFACRNAFAASLLPLIFTRSAD